jgi:hypothetical protein
MENFGILSNKLSIFHCIEGNFERKKFLTHVFKNKILYQCRLDLHCGGVLLDGDWGGSTF